MSSDSYLCEVQRIPVFVSFDASGSRNAKYIILSTLRWWSQDAGMQQCLDSHSEKTPKAFTLCSVTYIVPLEEAVH
jgi:hypothetical protein